MEIVFLLKYRISFVYFCFWNYNIYWEAIAFYPLTERLSYTKGVHICPGLKHLCNIITLDRTLGIDYIKTYAKHTFKHSEKRARKCISCNGTKLSGFSHFGRMEENETKMKHSHP